MSAEGRLYNLGIFDWAEIDPRRPVTTQTEETFWSSCTKAGKTTSSTVSASKW